MCDCTGEDLLRVFTELNVSLLNLNPNVVKAWFDTDDVNMKNLLTWMCTSLSKENYVSPLENAEFLQIETPLFGESYEREVESIDKEYPGIFDLEENTLEAELLQDEIELALEEEKRLDELIKINENLQIELSKELDLVSSEKVKTETKLKSTEEQCVSLSQNLDHLNKQLHIQLAKYGSNLYKFEFSPMPNFINNIDPKKCQESFDNIISFFTPTLEGINFCDNSCSTTFLRSHTNSELLLTTNDSIPSILNEMKSRISNSRQYYVLTKIEVEKAKEILNYLNKTDIDSILHLKENVYAQINTEGKEERKQRLCEMLDNVFERLAEHHIAEMKCKYAKRELEQFQEMFQSVKEIEETVVKFLSGFLLLNILYVEEKKDIDNSEQFFRKVFQYIGKDLQSSIVRTDKMRKIICECGEYNSKHLVDKSKMIKCVVRMLTTEPDYDLHRSVEIIGEFKTELDRLENKLFYGDFYAHKKMSEEIKNNIDILQSFLRCGPTHRIIVIPFELQQVLGQVDEHLKKQAASLRSALKISSSIQKIPDKWQNYRRQLWMYFYTDSKKLFLVLQEIEEEFKKSK